MLEAVHFGLAAPATGIVAPGLNGKRGYNMMERDPETARARSRRPATVAGSAPRQHGRWPMGGLPSCTDAGRRRRSASSNATLLRTVSVQAAGKCVGSASRNGSMNSSSMPQQPPIICTPCETHSLAWTTKSSGVTFVASVGLRWVST